MSDLVGNPEDRVSHNEVKSCSTSHKTRKELATKTDYVAFLSDEIWGMVHSLEAFAEGSVRYCSVSELEFA